MVLLGPTSMKQPLGRQTGTWDGGKMLRRTFLFLFIQKIGMGSSPRHLTRF